VAQKVLVALTAPFVIEGRALNVSASIGISVYPGDGLDFDELLKSADAARFAAQEAGGNTSRFFSREFNTRALDRLEMENDLHRAIARNEFVLRYQPIVRRGPGPKAAPASKVVGVEVLLHWQHPVKGLLAAEDFMPLAEQCGLAGAIGSWLIGRTCERIAGWREGLLAGLWFALNVSLKGISRDQAFMSMLERTLREHNLQGSRLSLELAERSMHPGGKAHFGTLKAIADFGVALTIDEFGTGQFDLAVLSQMPVRKLKIDRKFVADIATRDDVAVIVQTFAAMATGLGLAFAAEGVENSAQLARLEALGCEEWQGSLYSDPLEAAGLERLLSAPRAAVA